MEREMEHVRMLDAGRLRLPYEPLTLSGGFASVATDKFSVVAHGNQFGLTFVPTPTGFAMATQQQYDDGCKDFVARKQVAIDHGQNASHVDVAALAVHKQVELPGIAYQLSLSPDELILAVAYNDSLALFEVAAIYGLDSPTPYHTFSDVVVDEISWAPDSTEDGNYRFAVLTHDQKVLSCGTDGAREEVATKDGAVSISWSPAGDSIAVGTVNGSVDIFGVASLSHERSIDRPECCDDGFEAHHLNWAEEDVFLVGYRQYDADREETLAMACLFEGGECVELDELVAFSDVEGRRHQFFSVFLADWRMFFVGCSLSADIELLVADPDSGEWEVWKPSERYQARLPMNADDEEMFPLGLMLNLNSRDDVEIDDGKYPPPAVVSCATTDGLLVNFSFVDLTVGEILAFVGPPQPFTATASRDQQNANHHVPTTPAVAASAVSISKHRGTTSDVENIPASEDSDDSDLEEEMEEEREKAVEAFREIDAASSGVIDKSRFGDLLVMLGTTYGEDIHGKYATRLADESGIITEDDFVNWYVDWIFGEHESDDEDDDDDSVRPTSTSANALARFGIAEGSWRCDSCMVHNPDRDATKCISCEAPNPNYSGQTATLSSTTDNTVVSGKFSFGVSSNQSSTSTNTSFSFGVPQGSGETSSSISGFSFGVTPSTTVVATGGGFKFGVSDSSTESASSSSTNISGVTIAASGGANSTSGFRFGVSSANSSGDIQSTKEPVEDTHKPSKVVKPDQGYGKSDENEFAESDGEECDEEEERKEEEESARRAFAKVSMDADFIPQEKFPALFKALGSTYSDEEHSATCESLTKDGMINVEDFIKWYLDWLFGNDDESDEDEASIAILKPDQKMKSQEEIDAAFAKFKPKEGSWKCDVCLTVNPDPNAMKCGSCETPNPASPKVKSEPAALTSSGSIGAGRFTFATPSSSNTEVKTSGFSFGFSVSGSSSSQTSSSATGFSFGTPDGGGTSSSTTGTFGSASKPGGFSFGTSTAGATASTSFGSGFSFGLKPTGPTSSSVDQNPPTSSAYPHDTSKKALPPPAPGAYPPDTSKKAAPPPPPGAYPPDTSTKPSPTAFPSALPGKSSDVSSSTFSFGGMSSSLFGSAKGSETGLSTTKPEVSKGGSLFSLSTASAPDASAKTAASPFGIVPQAKTTSTSGSSFGVGQTTMDATAPTKPGLFGSSSSFSFGSTSTPTNPLTSSQPVKPTTAPGSSFSFSSQGLQSTEVPKLSGTVTLSGGPASAPAPAKTTSAARRPSLNVHETTSRSTETIGGVALPNEAPFDDTLKLTRATASSVLEAQLWKLVIDFDKAFRRVNHLTRSVLSSDKVFQVQFNKQVEDLKKKVASLCDEVNTLDDVRDQIEKDVLFVIGSDGDVHEQLEYGREVLASFKNEKLKRLLEEQPLDQRSEETRKAIQDKLTAVEKACDDLDKHISTTKNYTSAGAFGSLSTGGAAASSAHLFRALKQTYDSSKIQYNRVSQLAQQLEVLSMADRTSHQGVRGLTTSPRSAVKTKDDMVEIITQSETRSRNVRRNFLSLCNNVVTPRDVFSTPRRKLTPSTSPSSPRDKAFSRLMPRTQVTVASPVSNIKASTTSISFKDTPVKSGSKLFALAENKAGPKDAKTFIPTPQKKESIPTSRLAPQRPSIPSFGSDKGDNTECTRSSAGGSSSREPPQKRVLGFSTEQSQSSGGISSGDISARKTLSFENVADSSISTPKAKPSVTFSLPTEETKPISTNTTPGYTERLTKFYEVHNPTRVSQAEKTVADFQGKEEEMFKRLFAKYVPGSNDEDVRTFLDGGPVPAKSTTTNSSSLFSVPAGTSDSVSKSTFSFSKSPSGSAPTASPFGKPSTAASPFGKTAFSLGGSNSASSVKPTATPSVTEGSGFSGFGKQSTAASVSSASPFGKPTTATPSPFGAPASANPYKQRLIDFYTKHNPSKLVDVESTLEKYKGNEEKLFQNLAIKYKVNDGTSTQSTTTTTGFGSGSGFAPKSPAASPFGNTGTFSSISLGGSNQQQGASFGSASTIGFGAAKPAAALNQSPFVTAPPEGNAFRSVSFGTDQKPAFGTPAAIGGALGFPGFVSTTSSTFGSAGTSAFGGGAVNYREKLTQFYKQYNPEKLNTVDATLEKYKGNEAKLFQMLEQKYVKTAPPSAFGGGNSAPAFGGGSAFGAPSSLGASSGPAAFGAPSALGGVSASPAFGSASGLGGGAPAFGSRFGVPNAPSAGATPASGGFSAFSSQPASFGGFSGAQSGAFGAGAGGGFGSGTGGFGSGGGFGGGNTGGFGSTGGFGMR